MASPENNSNSENLNKNIMLFKLKKDHTLQILNDLYQKFQDSNDNNTMMFKLLNSARVLQGDVLNRIHNLNEEINKSKDEKKFKLLYDISILNSNLEQIKNTITHFENIIHQKFAKTNIYNNSNEIFTNYQPVKMKYNDDGDLSIEEIDFFDNAFLKTHQDTHFGDTETDNNTAVSISEPEQKTQDILENKKSKKIFFGGNIPCITLFYAPWCGWSKAVLPEWKKLENFAKTQKKFIVKKFNDQQHGEMMQKFGINGFPVIKLIKPNETIDYDKNRNYTSFIDFLDKHNLIEK